MRFRISMLLVVIAAFLPATAQNPFGDDPLLGRPLDGAFDDTGFEVINLENLNFSFQIPIASFPGRGVGLRHAISYNSLVWTLSDNVWVPLVDAAGEMPMGWRVDKAFVGNVVKIGRTSTQYYCLRQGPTCQPGISCEKAFYGENYYRYRDPNGTSRDFDVVSYNEPFGCEVYENPPPPDVLEGHARDGSGFRMTIPPASQITADVVVRRPDGTKIEESGTIADKNGNYVSRVDANPGETHYVDTLGRPLVKKLDLSGGDVEFQVFDGTSSAGAFGYQSYTIDYESYDVASPFQCPGIGDFTCPPLELPKSISLPSGDKYEVTYETHPTMTGFVTGRIKTLTLPTGAQYEYEYPGPNAGIDCGDGSVRELQRKVLAGGEEHVWNYQRSLNTTTVTYPQLEYESERNERVVAFFDGKPYNDKVYAGSTSGTLLREVQTAYSDGRPSSVRILLDGGYETRVEMDYDSYGNAKETREFGLVALGSTPPLIRSTVNSYAHENGDPGGYLGRNLANLITSTVAYDGDSTTGAVVGRMDFRYDEDGSEPGEPDYFDCASRVAPNHALTCAEARRGNLTSVVEYADAVNAADGLERHFVRDDFGNITAVRDDCCLETSWGYSQDTGFAFPESQATGPNSELLTTFDYEFLDEQAPSPGGVVRLEARTDPSGETTSYTTSHTVGPSGVTETRHTTTRPDGGQIVSIRDYSAQSSHMVSPEGRITTTQRDDLGRPSLVTLSDDLTSPTRTFETYRPDYDAWGRVYRIAVPQIGATRYWRETQFDPLDRQTLSRIVDDGGGTQGQVSTSSYDGKTITTTDPEGYVRKYEFGDLGRLDKVFEPDPDDSDNPTLWTQYTYNALGLLTEVDPFDSAVQPRAYTYDDLGRVTTETIPETGGDSGAGHVAGTYTYTYNSAGQLETVTDPRGVVATYVYDALRRLKEVQYPATPPPNVASVPDVVLEYGTSASSNNIGRLLKETQGGFERVFTYDLLGRVVGQDTTIDGVTYSVGLTYNKDDEITEISYPSGDQITYEFDAHGLVSEILRNGNRGVFDLQWNDAFQLTSLVVQGPMTVRQMTYDEATLSLTSIAHTGSTIPDFTYDYGPLAQHTGRVHGSTTSSDSVAGSHSYTYDSLGRLTNAQWSDAQDAAGSWEIDWDYDENNNRLNQVTTVDQTLPGRYPAPDVSHSYSAASNRISDTSYSYDASGNLLGDGVVSRTWDVRNRMASALSGSSLSSYEYSPTGQRYRKQVDGDELVYVWFGADVVHVDDRSASDDLEYYYYEPMQPLGSSLIDLGIDQFYYSDNLSIRTVTDGNTFVQQGHYPFGETWYDGSIPADTNLFTTYDREPEAKHDFAKSRYYFGGDGRFASVDPIDGVSTGSSQGLNRYSYAGNDPINFVDPLGAQRAMEPRKAGGYSITDLLSGNWSGGGSGGYYVTVCYRDNGARIDRKDDEGESSWELPPYRWCETTYYTGGGIAGPSYFGGIAGSGGGGGGGARASVRAPGESDWDKPCPGPRLQSSGSPIDYTGRATGAHLGPDRGVNRDLVALRRAYDAWMASPDTGAKPFRDVPSRFIRLGFNSAGCGDVALGLLTHLPKNQAHCNASLYSTGPPFGEFDAFGFWPHFKIAVKCESSAGEDLGIVEFFDPWIRLNRGNCYNQAVSICGGG